MNREERGRARACPLSVLLFSSRLGFAKVGVRRPAYRLSERGSRRRVDYVAPAGNPANDVLTDAPAELGRSECEQKVCCCRLREGDIVLLRQGEDHRRLD